ncbi:winged helix-turn-helix domain-containing protein [Alteromonas sp. ASW11-36]|uniref:Winged helix-turn-helix domain-containing protein n=1 Tax=Alteromonas arenosi TaxID=3055817 RepID=A0ABT7SSB9_9ALTE|nr:winged helix-turn-helix domain-containing protein [Alteromonas sp. ASW11-36]MDM7859088.1 winged helix-turn-helix domain-containing protein [Alteromonas sp. ASW11-36]
MKDEKLQINQWLVELKTGDLRLFDTSSDITMSFDPIERLDPKGVHLLVLLAKHPGELVGKEQLLNRIWSDVVVTEDALTRCVSRLRKALNDSAKAPRVIETLPKRGYRLVAETVKWHRIASEVSAESQDTDLIAKEVITPEPTVVEKEQPAWQVWGVAILIFFAFVAGLYLVNPQEVDEVKDNEIALIISQADDYYTQMRRADNEMAIELYQQAIAMRPDSGQGQAGLANALVQQVLRWPNPASEPELLTTDLEGAIQSGRTATPEAEQKLNRALSLAQRAVRVSPNDARSHKALGFVYSAQQKFDLALASYHTAVEKEPDAWDAMINIGDVLEITGHDAEAIHYFEQAFAAMGRVYSSQTARVRPWYAALGAVIGDKYYSMGQIQDAEAWYRHVMSFAPFHEPAASGLVAVLMQQGDEQSAAVICEQFSQRVGINPCNNPTPQD